MKLIYFSPDPPSPSCGPGAAPSQQQEQQQAQHAAVSGTLAAAAAAAETAAASPLEDAMQGTDTASNPQMAVQARSSTDNAVEHVPRSFRRPGQGNGSGGGNGRGGGFSVDKDGGDDCWWCKYEHEAITGAATL